MRLGRKGASIAALSALLIAGASIAGCTPQAGNPGDGSDDGKLPAEIVLGGVEPLTGASAAFGADAVAGAKIAVDEINAAGGINGSTLRIDWEDGQLDNQISVAATQKLFDQGVPAVITAGGGVVHAQIPIAEQAQKLLLNMGASTPDLAGLSQWLINTIPPSGIELQAIAELAIKDLGLKTAAILRVDSDTGKLGAQAFKDAFIAAGGQIVADEVYPVGATSMPDQFARIQAANPEALLVAGNIPEIGHAAVEVKQLGMQVQQLGYTITLGTEAFQIAQGAMDGLIGVGTVFSPDSSNKVAASFLEAWKKTSDKAPSVYAVVTYDTVKLFADAVAHVGYDAAAIQKYLTTVKDFPGAMGSISIGQDYSAHFDQFTYIIKDGKAVPYEGK